jgi:2',3'-cyclic-nucleotide 2'-phosphodiesterase (5'-nucleotidase family)
MMEVCMSEDAFMAGEALSAAGGTVADLFKKLTEEDRLRIQIFYLTIQNLELQSKQLQADLVRAGQLIAQQQQDLLTFMKAASVRYGIDLTKVNIDPEGNILGVKA